MDDINMAEMEKLEKNIEAHREFLNKIDSFDPTQEKSEV